MKTELKTIKNSREKQSSMTSVILYVSKTGNTEKVSNAIAKDLKIDAYSISNMNSQDMVGFWEKLDDVDLAFIGSGTYAFKIGTDLKHFLEQSKPPKSVKFALFGTWIGRSNSGHNMLENINEYLVGQGYEVIPDRFLCYGKMAIVKRSHPSQEDLNNAVNWAKKIAS
ncbi:MAG: hypothetical protein GF364_05600 [Candidatus Lokiarchaeota archaeon]|nr:hypothetical protein [Candidatus Lokiarchaeota archaeon]